MEYPVERFTEAERERLRPHFTNLDRPVFALVNLPETVKAALFARYSRYPGTLRRLFLEEFADDLPESGEPGEAGEGKRAAQLYERIFLGYGDDSVAQLGGAHLACEWVSNVLTKVLQRPRLGAYLEQSTRYIAYDGPMPGSDPARPGYRYYRDAELGPAYERAMDELFGIYSRALPRVCAWAEHEFPRGDEPPAAHARAIKAKALDLLRGLLPAASLSHMGIFATGQTYEQLILHLLAHPLPEAQAYGRMILEELGAVIPSFLTRVERPERGGQWIGYLEARERAGARWAARLGLDAADDAAGPSVTLLGHDGEEDDLLAALLFEAAATSERHAREADRRARRGRSRRAPGRPDRGARQSPPPPRAWPRDPALPIRDRRRLRRVPRSAAPPHADHPVAVADARSRRRRPRPGRARRLRRGVPARARDLSARSTSVSPAAASPPPPRTPCAWATGSGSSST